MDRGRKREEGDELPEYKRACPSEARPCTSASSSSPPPPTLPPPPSAHPPASTDCEMESTSSGRSDRAVDSGNGSYDSDGDSDQEHEDDGEGRSWGGPNGGTIRRVVGRLSEDNLEPSLQLAALTELCEWLSFCTEDSTGYFSLETVVPTLVRIAEQESDPVVMLLAIRAMTYLCDSMPRYTDAIVRHGALPVLCGKLLAIEYLDVAEQCLQALEKISRKQEVACLKAGTIRAVLGFIDFFSTSLQRVAISTIANVCKKLTLDFSSIVMESVPALCNLLQYEDQMLVEMVVICLIRIADCFNCSPGVLDELCTHGVVQKSLKLIANVNHIPLNHRTKVALVCLLRKLAASSLVAVKTLFELNIGRTLKDILMASELLQGTTYASLGDAHTNQVHEVFMLVNQLIPPVAKDVEDVQLALAKEKILADQPNFLHEFSIEFLPASIQVVNSGVNSYVCYCCVSTIQNIVYFSKPDMLLEFKNINISSFLVGLLARKNIHVLISTMTTIQILMQKLPNAFLSSFIKEGVIYAVEALSMQESCLDNSRCLCYVFPSNSTSQSEMKSCKIEKDGVHTLANCLRNNYFTCEALNTENGLAEIRHKLRTLCMVLNDNVDRCSTSVDSLQNEEYLTPILDQVMKELYGGESMSTFEFIQSEIVRSLAHYLSNGKYLSETSSDCNLSNHFLTVLRRFQKFAQICNSDLGKNGDNLLLTLLVRKLQNALSSLENFPVVQSQGFRLRNNYADIPHRCSTTNPCLKVHLLREKEEENLSDYNRVVYVDISSTLDAIEGYLQPKVQGKNECKSNPGETHLSKAPDSFLGSKCVLKTEPRETQSEVMRQLAFPSLAEIIHGQPQASVESISDSFDVSSHPASTVDGTTYLDNVSANNINSGPKLTLCIKGKQLDQSMTLYQAILENLISTEPDMIIGPKFWTDVYQLTYKSAVEPELNIFQKISSDSGLTLQLDEFGFSWKNLPLFSSTLLSGLPCEFEKSNPTYDILFMLKILEGLNRFSFHLLSDERINAFAEGRIENFDDLKVAISFVPQAEFISSKLTDKLEQQMRDPLVLATAGMPAWCSQLMVACPFLFPFEAKWKYFHLVAFGPSQQHGVQNSDGSTTNIGNGRRVTSNSLSRKKFKVNRGHIMESASKMMEVYAKSKSTLEVEYIDEVGTGLGPTMEFYTLVSREFQSVGLGMWRGDLSRNQTNKMVGDSQYVMTPFGLFPRPWSSTTSDSSARENADVNKKFLLLGKLVAKSIKDGRILDVPFSKAFFRLILEQELGIYDILSFDPELGRILLEFQAIINRRRFLQSTSGDKGSYELHYRNTRIEDLCLDFTLPGYPDFVLKSEDNSNMVTIDNLDEYLALVVDATVKNGISRQVEVFKLGFNEVFPLGTLQIFTEDELERVLCGERDTWSFNELVNHIKFDHGYTASNPSVINKF